MGSNCRDGEKECGKLKDLYHYCMHIPLHRCPISRKIVQNPEGPLVPMQDGPHVPPYYRDQMLLLMEVLDLEQAYYMEASL